MMNAGQDRAIRRQQQHAKRRRARRPAAARDRRRRQRTIAVAVVGVIIVIVVVGVVLLVANGGNGTDAPVVASRSVTVAGDEFSFRPPRLAALAGSVEVTLRNEGKVGHELVVLREGIRISRASEFDETMSLGRIDSIAPGNVRSRSFELAPGVYQFVCVIPGHLEGGMQAELVVE